MQTYTIPHNHARTCSACAMRKQSLPGGLKRCALAKTSDRSAYSSRGSRYIPDCSTTVQYNSTAVQSIQWCIPDCVGGGAPESSTTVQQYNSAAVCKYGAQPPRQTIATQRVSSATAMHGNARVSSTTAMIQHTSSTTVMHCQQYNCNALSAVQL